VKDADQPPSTPTTRRFGFIGVTSTRSSINRVFPRWAEVLELGPVEFDPVDLPVGTDPACYEEVVDRIAGDPEHVGALVTTHKVRLLDATRDRFASLDRYATLLGEISCISKRGSGLHGSAKDPLTSGAALDAFVPPRHFGDSGGHVLCLGAGGSGLAITVNLLTREDPADRPDRIVLVNRGRDRLEECARVLSELKVSDAVDLVQNAAPERNDELMAQLPPGSLVVNATGLGKDRPGSPITARGRFPRHGLVWEINYRGELDFLHQAYAQQQEQALIVEDGWTYFIHGWAAVVAEAFSVEIDDTTLERLSEVASEVRG
jgi:shikimate dehydrogenase